MVTITQTSRVITSSKSDSVQLCSVRYGETLLHTKNKLKDLCPFKIKSKEKSEWQVDKEDSEKVKVKA